MSAIFHFTLILLTLLAPSSWGAQSKVFSFPSKFTWKLIIDRGKEVQPNLEIYKDNDIEKMQTFGVPTVGAKCNLSAFQSKDSIKEISSTMETLTLFCELGEQSVRFAPVSCSVASNHDYDSPPQNVAVSIGKGKFTTHIRIACYRENT